MRKLKFAKDGRSGVVVLKDCLQWARTAGHQCSHRFGKRAFASPATGALRMGRLAAIAGLALLVGAGMQPAAAQTVTLAQVYQSMMAGDLELDILNLEAEVAAELVRQARGERFPRVSLNFQYAQVQQEIISSDNTTFQEGKSDFPTVSVSFLVTQPIFDQARWRSMGVAEAEQALVAARAEVAKTRLTGLMISSFLDVARAQYGRDRANSVLTLRSQLESLLALQVDAGTANSDLLIRVQGDVFAARTDLADAEMDLSDSLFELFRFSGEDARGVSLSGNPFGVFSRSGLSQSFSRDRLLSLSPEIQVAQAEVVVAEKQLARTKGTLRPTSDLVLEFSREKTDGSLFGGGSEVQSLELGLNVNVPIYEGGIRKSRVREGEKRIEIAKKRLAQVQELVLRRHDGLLVAYGQSAQRAGAVSQQLRVAEQALASAQEAEAAGRLGAEAVLEQRLRRDVLRIETQAATLRSVQVQAELLALFGALDIQALSGQISG